MGKEILFFSDVEILLGLFFGEVFCFFEQEISEAEPKIRVAIEKTIEKTIEETNLYIFRYLQITVFEEKPLR